MTDRKSFLANLERKRAKQAAHRRQHQDKYAGHVTSGKLDALVRRVNGEEADHE